MATSNIKIISSKSQREYDKIALFYAYQRWGAVSIGAPEVIHDLNDENIRALVYPVGIGNAISKNKKFLFPCLSRNQ